MKELYIDETAKWKTRELRQIHTGTADPFGIDRKSCMYNLMEYSVMARLFAHTAVCIWRNSLVFHFAGSSIYNSFIYGTEQL